MSYLPDKTFENVKAQVGSSVSAHDLTHPSLIVVEGTTITYTPAAGSDYYFCSGWDSLIGDLN